MLTLPHELRLATRALRAHPVFTVVAVVSFAIGVSVASGVVAVLDSSRGRGTPFLNAPRTVALYRTNSEFRAGKFGGLSTAAIGRAAAESRSLAAVAAWSFDRVPLRTAEGTRLVTGADVSAALPRILGVRAAIGRTFTDADEQPGATPTAMLTQTAWRTRFHGDSAAVGRTIDVGGQQRLIVGVLEPRARFPDQADLWLLRALRQIVADTARFGVGAVALLAPGATAQSATAELSGLGIAIGRANARVKRTTTIGAAPFADYLAEQTLGARGFLTMVGIVVALIAATNFAALVLARGIRRRGELAIRAALGASTSHIVRHLLAECLVIAAMGGALGAAGAPLVMKAIASFTDGLLPSWLTLQWSGTAVGAAFALAMILGAVFGLAPALELARPAASGNLRATVATRRERSGRKMLVTIQVALATGPVVFVAALFGGFITVGATPMGFAQAGLYSGTVGGLSEGDTAWHSPALRSTLLGAVHEARGVSAAALSHESGVSRAPTTTTGPGGATILAPRRIQLQQVTPGFFDVFRPTLIAGRLPTDDELARAEPVGVVTEAMYRAFHMKATPGIMLNFPAPEHGRSAITVVGVIADVRRTEYETDPAPQIFTGLGASEQGVGYQLTVWVRGTLAAPRLIASVDSRVRAIAPATIVMDLQPRADVFRTETREMRSLIGIAAAIFALAMLLAALGIYGTIAYSAVMRRKEVAVRLALGGSSAHVAGVVTREAAGQALIGLLLGVGGGTLATALMPDRTTPISFPPADVVFTAVITLMLVLAAAAIGPVRRVWRTDCAGTLREE